MGRLVIHGRLHLNTDNEFGCNEHGTPSYMAMLRKLVYQRETMGTRDLFKYFTKRTASVELLPRVQLSFCDIP